MRSGATLGLPVQYGLGLMQMPTDYGLSYGHGGLAPGYQITSMFVEDIDTTLVVGQNMGPGPVYSISYALLDQMQNRNESIALEIDERVLPKSLKFDSVHVRAKGQVNKSQQSETLFPKMVGYVEAKGKRWRKAKAPVLSSFSASLVDIQNESFLKFKAAQGESFLGIALEEVGKTYPFFELYLRNSNLAGLSDLAAAALAADIQTATCPPD